MLDEIALRCGTDKSSATHGYTRWYERHLAVHVSRQVTLLEIGIAGCASLQMWREYLGTDARVVGVDRSEACCARARSMGFEAHCGSQADRAFLELVISSVSPDVVVDDGSHHAVDQIASFEVIFPKLRDGALYAIEDLHAAYWRWGGDLMVWLRGLVDRVNNGGRTGIGRAELDRKFRFASELERTCSAVHFYPSLAIVEKIAKQR